MVEKTLPINAVINGYKYTQVKRDKTKALYAQEICTGRTQYEVFRIRVTNPKTRLAALYAKRGKCNDHLPTSAESFPGDEDFGKSAWSCFTLEDAQKRYEALRPRPTVPST